MNSSARHALLAQVHQHPQHLRLHGDVEHRDRLVADQAVRVEHERGGDRHALALAARKLVRVAVEVALRAARRPPAPAARAPRARPSARPAPPAARRRSCARACAGSASGTGPGRPSARAGAARAGSPRPRTAVALELDRARRPAATSPSIARASVDFPQPDSPTTPSTSPRPPLERHAVDGARGRPCRRWTRRSRTSISGAATRSRQLWRRPLVHGAKWQADRLAGHDLEQRRLRQAARRPRTGSAGGTRTPRACRPGRAARPGSGRASAAVPPIAGSESSSRFVYGCCGDANTVAAGPVSTIRPAYITATRSQVSASTAEVVA